MSDNPWKNLEDLYFHNNLILLLLALHFNFDTDIGFWNALFSAARLPKNHSNLHFFIDASTGAFLQADMYSFELVRPFHKYVMPYCRFDQSP